MLCASVLIFFKVMDELILHIKTKDFQTAKYEFARCSPFKDPTDPILHLATEDSVCFTIDRIVIFNDGVGIEASLSEIFQLFLEKK